MAKKRTLALPIVFGVIAVLFLITVLVGWSVIFSYYYILAEETNTGDLGVGFWVILSLGCLFLVIVIAILIVLLVGNVSNLLHVRRQNTFIDSVTHELKSPLAGIRLSLDTMAMRELSPEMQNRLIGMMRDDVDRLQTFIDHILQAGRIEHQEEGLQLEPTPCTEIIHRCVERVQKRHKLVGGQIFLRLEMEDDKNFVSDPVAFETIVLNLLDNAVKYSTDKKEVTLQLQSNQDGLVLSVSDKGMGLAKRELKRVFKRFHRVQREDEATRPGTGLGLFVVKSLVKKLGGKIWAESPGEGKGTTFYVRLPMQSLGTV